MCSFLIGDISNGMPSLIKWLRRQRTIPGQDNDSWCIEFGILLHDIFWNSEFNFFISTVCFIEVHLNVLSFSRVCDAFLSFPRLTSSILMQQSEQMYRIQNNYNNQTSLFIPSPWPNPLLRWPIDLLHLSTSYVKNDCCKVHWGIQIGKSTISRLELWL